jgi:hypothetical protein
MPKYKLFQPVKTPPNRHSIGGKLAVAAKRGMIVNHKAGTTDELELSTGKAGFFLAFDVVADLATLKGLIDANELRPNKAGFEYPLVAGSVVQAEDFVEVWVEGSDLLHASMDEDVLPDTPITTAAGKITVLTDSVAQEAMGKVVLNEAGKVDGDNRRFLLQIARSTKVVLD